MRRHPVAGAGLARSASARSSAASVRRRERRGQVGEFGDRKRGGAEIARRGQVRAGGDDRRPHWIWDEPRRDHRRGDINGCQRRADVVVVRPQPGHRVRNSPTLAIRAPATSSAANASHMPVSLSHACLGHDQPDEHGADVQIAAGVGVRNCGPLECDQPPERQDSCDRGEKHGGRPTADVLAPGHTDHQHAHQGDGRSPWVTVVGPIAVFSPAIAEATPAPASAIEAGTPRIVATVIGFD